MKVKGFTVIEISVGLALSSLAIGMMLILVGYINRQYSATVRDANRAIELARFQSLLDRDFLNGSKIIVSLDTLIVSFEDYTVKYSFDDSLMVRMHPNIHDTLRAESISFTTYEGASYLEGLVSEVLIKIKFQERDTAYFYQTKRYAYIAPN
jgi:hypothetical protein